MSVPAAVYDVAIVGAGPAGASAAIQLARAGRRVLLIDRKIFPRAKVCGGCLSGKTMARLRRLLGERAVLPGVPGTQISFVVGGYRLTCPSAGRTRVVLREELDAGLVQAALDAGAEGAFGEAASLVPATPQDVSAGAAGTRVWSVKIGSRQIDADVILAASGVGTGLVNRLGVRSRGGGRRMMAQQWIQSAAVGLPQLGQVELHWLYGGYVGLASPAPGQVVVALAAEMADPGGDGPFERLRRLNPASPLWNLLAADAPRRFGSRGTAGFPWVPDRLGAGNVLLIGDAAGYEEPYTGEGIGLALCSAECAVAAVTSGGDRLGHYERLMRRHHAPIVRRTRWISRLLKSRPVTWLAGRGPLLPESVLARMVEHIHVKGIP